jgi:hypothetical protein
VLEFAQEPASENRWKAVVQMVVGVLMHGCPLIGGGQTAVDGDDLAGYVMAQIR